MAAIPIAPVITKEAWAQCENPNCGKWRRLPLGAHIDDDAPWYCYMNPDLERNTCSASEVEYDDKNTLVISNEQDPEEAARNAQILSQLEASVAAAAAAAVKGGKGRGRGRGRGRGKARGRGRPPLGDRGAGLPSSAGAFDAVGNGGRRRGRSVSFAGDESFESDEEGAGVPSARLSRRQAAKHLQRLLENQGQWETIRPRGPIPAIPASLPMEALEALGAAEPDVARLACRAADLASSVRYFEGNGGASGQIEEVGAVARLAIALAAASGLVESDDALTKAERERLGLEGPVVLPEVEIQSLPGINGQEQGDEAVD